MHNRKYEAEQLYNQAIRSPLVRSCLQKQIARIRNLGTEQKSHQEYLKLSWVDAAVYSVYTGYVFLDQDFKMRFGQYNRYMQTGYQELVYGHDPFYNHTTMGHRYRLNQGFGIGQTLFDTVCDYDRVSRYVSGSIESFGSGMIQYATAQKLTDEQKADNDQRFQENGLATILYSDSETKVSLHQLKVDWQGVQIELEEKRLLIESMLWGSDTRKSATLVSEVEQSDSLNGMVAAMFNHQIIYACRKLFPYIDLKFVEKVDSIKDLSELAQSSVVSDKAVEEVLGSGNEFTNNDEE